MAIITLSPTSAAVGGAIGVSGSGFSKQKQLAAVTVTLDATPVATAKMNRQGRFSTSFQVPIGTTEGTHTITATTTTQTATSVLTVLATVTPGLIALGAYLPGAPSGPTIIDSYTTLVGQAPAIVMWYQDWSGPYNTFYTAGAEAIRVRSAMPVISWEPNGLTLASIAGGTHDAYIRAWTHAAAVWGYPLYVRPMYEMNGNWASWSPGVNGNTSAEFIAAWRRIVDLARAEGATNIRWVWAPNVDDGNPNLTPMGDIWPGDAWVDWLGLDGYNWGSLPSGNGWETFTHVFQTLGGSYTIITGLSAKPLMISETACTEVAGDKAAWITSAFTTEIPAMPRIRAVTWFNANKETDWRVNSSTSALAAFQAAAGSATYSGVLP